MCDDTKDIAKALSLVFPCVNLNDVRLIRTWRGSEQSGYPWYELQRVRVGTHHLPYSLVSAKIFSHLDPSGLMRSESMRPDGMTIVSWSSGKVLVWDATNSDVFSYSTISLAVNELCAAVTKAENIKISKLDSYLFVPVMVETCGVLDQHLIFDQLKNTYASIPLHFALKVYEK